MQYKPSYYNHMTKLNNGKYVIYNFMTGGLVELEDADVDNIKQILSNCNDEYEGHMQELKEGLIENFYLIPDDTNELNIIRTRNLSRRFSNDSKFLVIMPTMECNFDCSYCYESRVKGMIKPHVVDGVKKWAEGMAKSSNYFGIGWFGGEPLMGWDTIVEVNSLIKPLAEENDCSFYSNITTNGYLLDHKKRKMIDDLGVTSFQITIDGTAEYHNKYRPLRNHKGSFDRVFENTMGILEDTNANLSIRVNVDQENYESVPKLMDMIPKELRTERLKIYFRSIFPGPNEDLGKNEKINSKRLNSYEVIKNLYTYALDHGFYVNYPVLNTKDHYCESCLKNHYVVHPSGDIYKCTVEFELGNRIGHIKETGEVDIDFAKYSKWLDHVPGDDPQCKKCKFLPVCHGGCRYQRMAHGRGCPYEVTDLKGMLDMLHLSVTYDRKFA